MPKKVLIWSRVDAKVKALVERLAFSKGISISEYLRQLVLEDLDKRAVFTTILKEDLSHET